MRGLNALLLFINPFFYYANIFNTDLPNITKIMVGIWVFNLCIRNIEVVITGKDTLLG